MRAFLVTGAVMDDMGAKNDQRIQKHGEWWRVIACNWLHAGLIHLAMNMTVRASRAKPPCLVSRAMQGAAVQVRLCRCRRAGAAVQVSRYCR